MKRGFLNTSKGKKALSQVSTETVPLRTSGKDLQEEFVQMAIGGGAPGLPNKVGYGEVPDMYRDGSPLKIINVPMAGTGQHGLSGVEEGITVWLVRQPTLEKILGSHPKISAPPKPKSAKPAYVVQSTPDKGLGVFATQDIAMGELIFSERPLLIAPINTAAALDLTLLAKLRGLDPKRQLVIIMENLEGHLRRAVDAMRPEDREEYMKLANSHLHDGSGPMHGILRTNGFGVGSKIFDGNALEPDQSNSHSAVTKVGSRINHSCIPNIKHEFSISSFSFQFEAVSDIKAGEELVYSYSSFDVSAAERRAELAPYGFVCHCPACENATPESDALRKSYKGLVQKYMRSIDWVGRTGPKESAIEPVLTLHKALLKEGLGFTQEYKTTVLMLKAFYEAIGMHAKARPYREELRKYPLPGNVHLL